MSELPASVVGASVASSASASSPAARAINSSTASCTALEETVTPETASTAWLFTICSAHAPRMSSVSMSTWPSRASEDTTAWVRLPSSTVTATSMSLKSVVLRTA